MRNGVVAGKFWPFHRGHEYLLQTAAQACDHLDVLLVGRPTEFPRPKDRALAIYETLHGFDITIHIVGDIETIDDTEESSRIWADYAEAILGHTPNVVFSSEEYGARWARYMECDHVMVDFGRVLYPISGTEVRENFFQASSYLPRPTRGQVLPRVVVLGSESTGTSTLAKMLGYHYDTKVVPEYGRILAENYKREFGEAPPESYWDDQIFRLIVHGQNAMEERLAKEANGVLICDTDALASAVWYERYHDGRSSIEFDRLGINQSKKHDLYIVTDYADVPWEDDGTRDGEKHRAWMQESFVAVVKKAVGTYGGQWLMVSGTPCERFETAIAAVEKVLDRHAYSVVQ